MQQEEIDQIKYSEVISDRDYWRSLAPEGWVLHGWTYRDVASFRIPNQNRILEVTKDHIEFFYAKRKEDERTRSS